MKKCMVTGATGHVGSALIKELLHAGWDVTAFILPGESLLPFEGAKPTIFRGDVRDPYAVLRACIGMDTVFHLAGIVSIGSGKQTAMEQVNIGGTKNIIRACKTAGVKRLVYVSSVHAIPEPDKDIPIKEVSRFDPAAVKGRYAKTKAAATQLVLNAAKNGLDAVVVHPSGVIGPYEHTLSNIGQMIVDTLNGSLHAYIDGKYNFVDVRDVARGIRLAADRGKSGECYILSGEVVTVKEMLDTITRAAGILPVRTKLPYWLAQVTAPLSELYYKCRHQKPLYTPYAIYTLHTNCNFDCSKAEHELGYRYRSAAKSLQDTVLWMIENQKAKPSRRPKRKFGRLRTATAK